MPNPFMNFCYSVEPDGEEMQAKANEQANLPSTNKETQKMAARQAAKKRAMEIKIHNDAVKQEAKREVRRPGLDYTMLFEFLDQLVGNKKMKEEVISDIVEEALRFKRRKMAQQLVDYMQKMKLKDIPNLDRYCKHCKIMYPRALHSCECKGRNIG